MKSLSAYLLIGLFSFTLILSCKKENDDTTDPTPNPPAAFTPLVTAVGTPVGSPNSATIGVAGGSIFSDDGRLEVIVHPNALNADTEISIQPITNECPGGVGFAYELSPDGMQFNVPITLAFHYTTDEIIDSAPNALSIATQHDDNIWYSLSDKTLDESTSTVSISTTHFSPWALLEGYSITPWEATIDVNDALPLVVYNTPTGPESNDAGVAVAQLGTPAPMSLFQENITWSVNSFPGGTFNDGMMNPESGSSSATYTAPAHIANMTGNPVAVRALIDFGGGASISLQSIVTVEETGEEYTLHFESDFAATYTTFQCLLGGGQPYWDGFEVHITVNENGVATNSISNFTPAALFSSVVCDCQNIVFDGQGSLIEFSNFVATHDGSGQLFFDYTYSWNGPDETIDCGDGSNTFDGMDWTEVDGGNFFLPADSVVYDWWPGLNGTVKIVHVE